MSAENNSSNFLSIQSSINHAKTNPILKKGEKVTLKITPESTVTFSTSDLSKMYRKCRPYIREEVLDPKYYGKPKRYCNDKFGTTDMDDFILFINGKSKAREFTSSRVKYLTEEGLELYEYIRGKLEETTSTQLTTKKFRDID